MEEKFEFKEGQWNIGIDAGRPPRHAGAAAAAADPKAPPTGGFFVAWDPVANKAAWRIPFQPSGGALSTAGQLIFVGNIGGQVLRARSGDRQDAVGAQAAAGRRHAGHLRAGRQAVHRRDVGRSKGRVFAFALDAKETMPK